MSRYLDTSVFKKLAHNDTGAAKGHQGGIVIPKDIAEFFPPLANATSTANPTVDKRLTADLFVDGARVGSVVTRYQHQTWGGTRPPERRLTDNLGAIRNAATKDDIVLFSKDLSDDDYIQVSLVRRGTQIYRDLDSVIGSKRWGAADPNQPPVSLREIKDAEAYISELVQASPTAFIDDRALQEVTTIRKARDRAFRIKVLEQYNYRCAFTGRRFASPLSERTLGLDAAHVVPVMANGSDHPANGLSLTKELHWAFDRGLVGVSQDRKVIVPDSVASLDGNEFLRELHGSVVADTVDHNQCVLDEALDWHRRNVLLN